MGNWLKDPRHPVLPVYLPAALAVMDPAQLHTSDRLLLERRAEANRYARRLASNRDFAGHALASCVVHLRQGHREPRNYIAAIVAPRGLATRPGTDALHWVVYDAQERVLCPSGEAVAAGWINITSPLPPFQGMDTAQSSAVRARHERALHI
jgi:dTDP-4-amino-4,6-dideoxygalactose transaminase